MGIWMGIFDPALPPPGLNEASRVRAMLTISTFSWQASGRHWAAEGRWGLPVSPGAGGRWNRAVQVMA